MLLWSLDETARQLGGVSIRTVRRMVERGEIISVRVGRLVKIQVESVLAYVASKAVPAHNSSCVGSLAWKGNDPCHTDAKAHLIGGQSLPTQAARELDVLLAQLTKRKLKR